MMGILPKNCNDPAARELIAAQIGRLQRTIAEQAAVIKNHEHNTLLLCAKLAAKTERLELILARLQSARDGYREQNGQEIDEKHTCSVPWCKKRINCNGLCSKHYNRKRMYGDPYLSKQSASGGVANRVSSVLMREVEEGVFRAE